MWNLRAWCLCLMFVCLVPSVVRASVPVRLVTPKLDTGCQILRQFLQDRGFLLEPPAPTQAVLTITIEGARRVRMDYRHQRRSFRLPMQIQSPRTRAHAIISMAEVFLEETKAMSSSPQHIPQKVSHRASPPSRQGTRSPIPGATRPKQRPTRQLTRPGRRTKRTRSTRQAIAPRRVPAKPRRVPAKSAPTARGVRRKRQPAPRQAPPVRIMPKAQIPTPPRQTPPTPARRLQAPNAKTAPTMNRHQPRSPQRSRPTPPPGARQPALAPRLALTPRPAPESASRKPRLRTAVRPKAGLVATADLRHKRTPLPQHRNWHIEFGGAFKLRWADNPGESWGGAVTAGLLIWDFTLQLEVSLLSFWLKKQAATIPIFRSKLLGGWRLPLQRLTDRFEIYILGGVLLDPYIIEQTSGARSVLHLGLALDVQVQFRIVSHLYVFFRYGFSVMFLSYEPDPEGQDIRAYPAPYQQSSIVGLQFRL